jgi:hypothetical protein
MDEYVSGGMILAVENPSSVLGRKMFALQIPGVEPM